MVRPLMLNASVTISPENFRSLRRMLPMTGDIVAGMAALSSMISPSSSVSVGFDFTLRGNGLTAVASICGSAIWPTITAPRSEEHTSELQSQFHLVCRLLLEKKKKNTYLHHSRVT